MRAVFNFRFPNKYIFILLVFTFLFSIYWNKWKKTEYPVGLELREKLSTLQSIFPLEVQSVHNLRLNVHLSNEIGIFRDPVDTRHDSCKSLKYDTSDMPTVSVVIPFYNEIWSVLLRTCTGILFRSPPHLIKEIILVDDGSTFEFLGEPLDYFLKQTPKTRVIRHSSRQGLIQTRMTGATAASGDALIFLDSHSEVSPHWLEPLLDELKKNPRVLYSPVIDWINPDTYEWSYATEILYSGVFTWDFINVWMNLPDNVKKQRHTEAYPLPTPTIIGCAIAVNRKVFFELGAFDEDVPSVWGGENIELPWRYWMRAGGVQTIPCSRVGHIFRSLLPYYIPEPCEKNYQRAAEIWMGEYRKFYYASIHARYPMSEAELKSIQDRKRFISDLKCHNFQWYLDTVLPDIFIPWANATMQGQIENFSSGMCLLADRKGQIDNAPCSKHDRRTYFYYTNDKRVFSSSGHCLLPRADDGPVKMSECSTTATPDQQWDFVVDIDQRIRDATKKKPVKQNKCVLVRIESNVAGVRKCLTLAINRRNAAVGQSWSCDNVNEHAHWYLTYNMDFTV